MTSSISPAAREPAPAVSNSSTTASGVTTPAASSGFRGGPVTVQYRNPGVDIDLYIARNQPTWDRLAELTARACRRVGDLDSSELDELLQLYQRTSAHLSYARTYFHDTALTARLTRLVADASGVIYGKRARSTKPLRTFFAVTYPAAVWDSRRFVLIGAALLFVPAILFGAWLINDPRALEASGSRQERQIYVNDQFEQYYSNQPHAQFFTEVTVNNILVSFISFAGGALFCVFGAYELLTNGLLLGRAGAWMITGGSGLRFFGLIAPHGLLELSAICIAAGTGLRLGWLLIAPGDRTRRRGAGRAGAPVDHRGDGAGHDVHLRGHHRGLRHGQRPRPRHARGHRRRRLAGLHDLPGGVRAGGGGSGVHGRAGRGRARRRPPPGSATVVDGAGDEDGRRGHSRPVALTLR